LRESVVQALPAILREKLRERTFNRRRAELDGLVKTMIWPELIYLAADRLAIGSPSDWIAWRNRLFCGWAGKRCLEGIKLVWAFDTSSYELFVEAKRRGISCVLDMTIAHPVLGEQIMDEYARHRPHLKKALPPPAPAGHIERRQREIEMADRIMAGSHWVRDSLLGVGIPECKIIVNPYGVDLQLFSPPDLPRNRDRAIRFLFVGWFSARKGIYDLLDAWKLSRLWKDGAELVMAGGCRADLSYWPGSLPERVSILGRVPHSELAKLYRTADVFVFPSLFEGSAKVVLEAMAAGLPVLTSPQACDEHCVVDGKNGFRVSAGAPSLLAERMRELAENRFLRAQMSAHSLALVGQYSWSCYGDRCADVCRELLREVWS
jgi:glycosyltransferase involved in cell wall biosynthesis